MGSGGTVDTEEIGVLGVMPGVTYYYRVRALVLEEGMTEGGAVQVVRRTDPSAPTGGATPVYAPVLCSPLDGAAVTPSQIAFRWFSVDGGVNCRLEVSNTPTFDAERTVRSLDEDRRFSLPGGVGTRTMSAVVNVADAFPQAQYLFWRIGALHSADAVAPEGGFIFATAGSVSVPEMPPLPAGRRQ